MALIRTTVLSVITFLMVTLAAAIVAMIGYYTGWIDVGIPQQDMFKASALSPSAGG